MNSFTNLHFNFAFIFLMSFFSLSHVWGAACCGGGVAAPSLILGDDKAILTNSFSHGTISDDVSSDGMWRRRHDKPIVQSYRLEGAHILYDRFQIGASLPFVSRSQNSSASSTGLGDVAMTGGYEFLPDWNYNPWRPKGLGFLQLTLPTGTSIYEADDEAQLEARGRGFWALGIGSVLTKSWGRWDSFLNFEIHKSFDKTVDSKQVQGSLHLEPGWGGTAQIGVGYNQGPYRIGGSVQSTYEDPIRISGTVQGRRAFERSTTAIGTLSYLWSDDWTLSASYADQTLLGSPRNTSLGQTVGIQIQRRWSR